MNQKQNRQYRISNPKAIDELLIEVKIKDGFDVFVQFSSEIYTDEILNQLNRLSEKYDESFGIRFYGFYQSHFDCKTVEKIPAVKSLFVDCLRKVENIDSLAKLNNLKVFNLGIFELKDTEILRFDNFKKVHRLLIGETKTKALNLEYLKSYTNLTSLTIVGHSKNIEVVAELKNLEELCLSSVSNISISFVNNLKRLKELYIILGGRENLNELESNSIERLSIVRVRGFNDMKCLSKFEKLRILLIEDEIRLENIDFTNASKNIEDVRIFNCKKLKEIEGITCLQRLERLDIHQTSIDAEKFTQNKFPRTLKDLFLSTGKISTDKKLASVLLKMGFPGQSKRYEAVEQFKVARSKQNE